MCCIRNTEHFFDLRYLYSFEKKITLALYEILVVEYYFFFSHISSTRLFTFRIIPERDHIHIFTTDFNPNKVAGKFYFQNFVFHYGSDHQKETLKNLIFTISSDALNSYILSLAETTPELDHGLKTKQQIYDCNTLIKFE